MASAKNIGDQLRDAVEGAVSSQDFSMLQQTIERSIGVAADNIGKGLAQASAGIQRAQAEYAREQEKRQREQRMLALYAKTGASRGGGIALLGWGIVVAVPLLTCGIIAAAMGSPAVGIGLGIGAACGVGLTTAGIKRLGLVRRFERYRDVIGIRDYCYLEELAASTADTSGNVLKNVKKMLGRGMFKQAALDDSETLLIMTSSAYHQYRQAQTEAQKRRRQQSLIGRTPTDSATAALTPEAQALLERGEAFVAQIRASNDAIPGEEISQKIDQIERVVRTIFDRAAEQPQVIDDLGQLMDYYLPTTIKLLDAYRDLDAQPIQGESIQKSKREIEGALDSLNVAFEKLLDSIFRDVAWDVSTDISVLHTVLSQEGLVNSPFESGEGAVQTQLESRSEENRGEQAAQQK